MKKYLLISLTAFVFAACAEKLDDAGSPSKKGELETSYIAVTLKADDMGTRASEDYEYGTEVERYVKTAHFFLFNPDGSAFPVNADGNNYLSVSINATGTQPGETGQPDEGPNVSDVKDKVLVFDNYKGEYPTHIVAVLNWDVTSPKTSYSLQDLTEYLSRLRNAAGNFVMSNSVYADMQGKVINANVLTEANIGKSEAEAKENPVKIYVERVSAKVELTADGDVAGKDNTFNIHQSVADVPVYVKVLGWELYNDYEQSYLLKHIYPQQWGSDAVGFLWNDPVRFRSYWGASKTGDFPDNHFDWKNDVLSPAGGVAYCAENTRNDFRTKVIIKALLVKEDGASLEVARWFGHHYAGEDALRTEVADLLSSRFFYKEGEAYKSIRPDDLMAVEADEAPSGIDIESYEVFFQLSVSGVGKDWYVRSQAGGYQAASDDAVNTELAAVEPALLYKNGQTYYHTDIRHFGVKDSESEFGIIRNHIYKVNIKDIKGFGTPVYDPETDLTTPEHPDETTSYVAAEVRILSWKVVKHDYSVE